MLYSFGKIPVTTCEELLEIILQAKYSFIYIYIDLYLIDSLHLESIENIYVQ